MIQLMRRQYGWHYEMVSETKLYASKRGSIVVTILVLTVFLSTLVLSLLVVTQANLQRARGRILLLQAQYSAESGADAAISELNNGNTTYAGEVSEVTVLSNAQYRATFTSSVVAGVNDKERIIVAEGKVYSPASAVEPRYTRTVRVTAERTTTTTASSMLSRNIVEIASGVKNIVGKDIYVNSFIKMNKNTTNLIAENVTVAGREVSAGNCSIGGTGNLVKPTAFSDPAQTKTILRLAYNNCVSPPGNVTNADFEVYANQSTISTVQSTYIPWDEYLDGSYTAANSCNDWTSGASPRAIPSTDGSKQTHYPDTDSNVANSCGTNGNLNLGSTTYTINDSVHIRANLCATSACTPTFNNPSSDVRYVFVEGTMNFDALNSAVGSGPIVFITYGADPASKTSVCPHGGSVYLGSSGSTSTYAPNIYLLAMNGICLDKTKFSEASQPATQPDGLPTPALGGIGGKNIYVSTNPGSPWDLALDPDFPVDQIPIDLSWRQARYERL